MFGNARLNIFVWIGFILDLIGFFVALWASFTLGVTIIIIGLVFSIIGLLLCIKNKEGVFNASLYVVLDIAFLIYLFVIH